MATDAERLAGYVATWGSAVDDCVALLRSLDPKDWDRPTDLPGWDVRAVAAHLAHLESVLAGHPEEQAEVPQQDHAGAVAASYTEVGPMNRRDWSGERIVDELESCAASRLAALRADPPTDGNAPADITPGGIGWSWETLLSNRVVDLWMHEQDVRRAVDRPGGLDTPAAGHTVAVLGRALGYVVGKRVAPPAGTSVALEVTGVHGFTRVVAVGEDGRAVRSETTDPTVRLAMDVESFVLLAGGRRDPDMVDVEVTGDRELATRVMAALAVTP